MRRLVELYEEVDEMNYFLKEWQRLKARPQARSSILAKPELRFICRTLERLIDDAQELQVPLVLNVQSAEGLDRKPSEKRKTKPRGSKIELSRCLVSLDKDGVSTSYVGNKHGLLSVARLAEMVAGGGKIELTSVALTDWG